MKKLLLSGFAMLLSMSAALAQIQSLPIDPAVKVGKLDNGMTYYIRHNALPEQRAEFYLATNVGAIQETPDQDGLAHFLEHMCFNGTKNFPEKNLLNWLESIGASFGGNINASTGIEQTNYMLNNIPLVRSTIIDSCLLIMHDYSHFVNCDPKEIDAERGVILEEKRTRNVAGWRNYMASRKYLYQGTKLAEVSLIGSEENLKNFKPESLVNFYKTWYRPDMQALIVVGDVDVNDIEQRIKTIFADIPAAENPKAKTVEAIPENEEPIIGIITDKETTNSSVEIYWKSEANPKAMNNSPFAIVQDILEDVLGIVMNERFSTIAAKPDAPFMHGSMGADIICEANEAVVCEGSCKDGETLKALEALLTEAVKASRFGFTEDEFTRAKQEILSRYETRAKKAATRKNSELVRPIINNFFRNRYLLDPEQEYQFVQMVMSQLTVEQINQVLKQAITPKNMVVLVVAPEKEGLVNPTREEVAATLAKVQAADIKPDVVEAVPTAFLNPVKLKGSAIKANGAYEYESQSITLANGVKVILRPSDIEKDRILFNLYKKGGRSLLTDEELYQADDNVWSLYVRNSGVSEFSKTTVNKMLSGKQLGVTPYISQYVSGVSGNSTRKDLETALQLVYLYYMDPRFDEDEYNQGMSQINAVLPNLVKQPRYQLQKQIYNTLYNSPRRFMVSEESIAKANLKGLEKVYRKVFNGVGGATLVITGDFSLPEAITLVQKYIGSIKKGAANNWKYCGDGFVDDSKVNDFTATMEQPKVTVLQCYKSNQPGTIAAEVNCEALSYILDMVYVATLREEEGGTYGASSGTDVSFAPYECRVLQVYFDTNEEQADKLRELAKKGLNDIAIEGPTAEQFDKTVKNLQKNIPEAKLRNSFWRKAIEMKDKYGYDYVADYENAVNSLTPEVIQQTAADFINGNCVELVMRPQK